MPISQNLLSDQKNPFSLLQFNPIIIIHYLTFSLLNYNIMGHYD